MAHVKRVLSEAVIRRRAAEGRRAKVPPPKISYEEQKAQEIDATKREACECIRSAVAYLKAANITIGGCGCCGSPWLSCETCNRHVDSAERLWE